MSGGKDEMKEERKEGRNMNKAVWVKMEKTNHVFRDGTKDNMESRSSALSLFLTVCDGLQSGIWLEHKLVRQLDREPGFQHSLELYSPHAVHAEGD
jgi:hypothetical protein